jgi:hypothetical protein
MQRRTTVLVAAALSIALTANACSNGDDADPSTTTELAAPTTTSTQPPATTPVPTTPAPTTAATTAAPTTTVSPTTPVDDLKAQIAADYVAAHEGVSAMLAAPSADDIDGRLALFAAPGTPYFEAVKANLLEHVRLNEVTVPSDPPYNFVTVESVELLGAEPVLAARLTVCQVDNLKRVLPASASPVGEEVLVYGGELNARRFSSHVVLTPNGWLQDEVTAQFDETYQGATECGAGPS